MKKEDVIYNIKLSFDFYIKEIFCRRHGLYENVEKKYQSVIKNKKYSIDNNVMLLDDNLLTLDTFIVTSNGERIYDYVYSSIDNAIIFNKSFKNVIIKYKVISVDVIDEYPEGNSDDFKTQIISISISDFFSNVFDVTGTLSKWKIPFYVDAFLFSKTIRDKISSAMTVMFRSISMPIFDFIEYGPILKDGTLNMDFSFYSFKEKIDKFGEVSVSANDLESIDKKKMFSCTVSGVISVVF